nr:phospholipase-like protein [Tanacetum cinerariifolium]
MSDSSGDGLSDLDDIDDLEMIRQQVQSEQEQEEAAERLHHRNYIYQQHLDAEKCLMTDYFGTNPKYPLYYFRKQVRSDATGLPDFSVIMKCMSAIRQLAYGVTPDALDEYLQMGNHCARDCLDFFAMVAVANNNLTVLNNSPLLDDILDDIAPVAPFECNELFKDRLNEDRRTLFKTTCFGTWLDIIYVENDDGMVHYVLHKQCCNDDDNFDLPLIYHVNGHSLHFGRREFCLLTGFEFGSIVFAIGMALTELAPTKDEVQCNRYAPSNDYFMWYVPRSPSVFIGGLYGEYINKRLATRAAKKKSSEDFHPSECVREASLIDRVRELKCICETFLTLLKEVKSLRGRIHKLESIIQSIFYPSRVVEKQETLKKVVSQIEDYLQSTSEDEPDIQDHASPKQDVCQGQIFSRNAKSVWDEFKETYDKIDGFKKKNSEGSNVSNNASSSSVKSGQSVGNSLPFTTDQINRLMALIKSKPNSGVLQSCATGTLSMLQPRSSKVKFILSRFQSQIKMIHIQGELTTLKCHIKAQNQESQSMNN